MLRLAASAAARPKFALRLEALQRIAVAMEEVDEINSLFVEARDEIEYASEDSETVYFNDSVQEAKVVVDKCLDKWAALLTKLPDDERAQLQRSMGLKIEQLKAEFEQLAATHS